MLIISQYIGQIFKIYKNKGLKSLIKIREFIGVTRPLRAKIKQTINIYHTPSSAPKFLIPLRVRCKYLRRLKQ